jgi:hypothetical protein
MHLFGHNVDHDYYFKLLREEERDSLQAKLLLLLLATSARLEAQEARVVDLLNVNLRTEPPSCDFHQLHPTAYPASRAWEAVSAAVALLKGHPTDATRVRLALRLIA